MKNIKIVIDKRKLDTLLRLGCPDSALIETIKTGKAKKTGDSLIDDYLQTFFVVKTFSDKWGGNHNPTGKNQINSKTSLGQLDRQDEGQDIGQDIGQDVDIDKDIDNIFSLENKRGVGEKENLSLKESSSLQKQKRGGKKFIAPSIKEVADYCQENKMRVDPETFVDYYTAKGWVVGKSPMKDWRAAVRNWNRKNNETSSQKERDCSIPVSLLKEKPKILSDEEKEKDKQDFNDLIGRIKEFSDEV